MILLFFFGLLGIAIYCVEVGLGLQKLHPTYTPGQIWAELKRNEWLTTIGSILAVIVWIVFIGEVFNLGKMKGTEETEHKLTEYGKVLYKLLWVVRTITIVVGYLGQRALYKILGRTEKKLGAKVDNI